jgi:EmrB/QacA subfamily drug resistance transporter
MSKYLIFLIVSIAMLITTMSGTVVAVAFPNIITSFNTSLIVAGWVLGVNQLASTASMPLIGKIGDLYGNKKTALLCLGIFTFGSLLCALAQNIEMLIVFRFIQGLGMGGFLPIGSSIIADNYHEQRQKFIGLFASVNAVGSIIGPNLGGWLTTAFGWKASFWIFVPFGLIMLVAIMVLIPKGEARSGKLDFGGAGLLAGILSAFMIGISLMGKTQQGISWIQVGLCFTIGVLLLVFFFRRQSRVDSPIIDIEILKEKRFLAANIYNFILGGSLLGITSFIPLYAVSIFGMSTFDSGLVMTPRSIGIMVASVITSLYVVRWGYRKPMVTGAVVTAASFIMMGILNPNTAVFGWQINGFVILSIILLFNGAAWGITTPAANNACIELLPERVGTIVGVRGMFRQLGSTIGISVITLVLNNAINLQQGFVIVLIGMSILLLISLPLIYIMPKNASALPVRKGAKPT